MSGLITAPCAACGAEVLRTIDSSSRVVRCLCRGCWEREVAELNGTMDRGDLDAG